VRVAAQRGRGRFRLALLLMVSVVQYDVAAQSLSLNPGPPGPYVFDVRAAASGIPNSETFVLPSAGAATLPTRGFGGAFGGHLYAIRIGPGRLGVGVDLMVARGTTPDVTTKFSSIDPQISINFGTSDGWSYLSGGIGAARVSVDPAGLSESVQSINWGGGARWFLGPHFGIGFDIRVRTLSAGDVVPKGTSVAAAVGLSLK
jgi:hypothetical protein